MSSVPSKIRCDSAIVVSSGLPMVLPSQPLPASRLASSGDALRMDEQRHAELLGLGPHRMELGVGEFHAGDHAADRGALQPLLLHRGLELLHGEVGRLQGERGEGGEAVGLGGAELGQLLVLHLDDLAGEVAVAAVPEGIDRQHLHVDRLRVHGLQPLVDLDEGLGRAVDRRQLDRGGVGTQQRTGLAEVAMRVHVDGLDLLAVDGDGQVACRASAHARCSSRPQLQKTIPVAAAVPPLRKFRRVVMRRPSEDPPVFFLPLRS